MNRFKSCGTAVLVLLCVAVVDCDALSLSSSERYRSIQRRVFLSTLPAVLSTPFVVASSRADEGDSTSSSAPSGLLAVTVTSAVDTASFDPETAALYITARPNTIDDVPKAILDGSRGKSPPVLVARVKGVPAFPFQYHFTDMDVTVEGRGQELPASSSTAQAPSEKPSAYWWQLPSTTTQLVVSARLDSDGTAATRDPADLVGRGISTKIGSQNDGTPIQQVTVELQGRGAAGKFFTGKK